MIRFTATLAAIAMAAFCQAREVPLATLDLDVMTQGHGKPGINKSVTGKALSVGGRTFETGVGTHASSRLYLQLDGKAQTFQAMVGVDDEANKPYASIEFQVFADGLKVYDSGVMRKGMDPKSVNVELAGVNTLLLKVSDAGDGKQFDHADWAEAKIVTSGAPPVAVLHPPEAKVILTPKPGRSRTSTTPLSMAAGRVTVPLPDSGDWLKAHDLFRG